VQIGVETAEDDRGTWLARLRTALRAKPRPVPGVRALRTTLRTLHLIAVAALYGGHVYGAEAERLAPALAATVATGALFVALEVYRSPVWLVQVRGIATGVKLALVACVALAWDLRVPILTLAVAIGAVTAHMPGRWRYHSVLHGRPVGPRDLG
jgi:hypothetical protein